MASSVTANEVPSPTLDYAPRWWAWFVIAYIAAVLFIDAFATIPARLPNPYAKEHHVGEIIVGLVNRLSPMPLSSFQWHGREAVAALSHTPLPGWSYAWLGREPFSGFDYFKFIFWFLVPLALCGRQVDVKAFGISRWRRGDWYLLGVAGVLGFLAVCLVPLVPGLQQYYGAGTVTVPLAVKLQIFVKQFVWTISWITGWEFLHRYFLLRAVAPRWPRWAWFLPAFFEGMYHLQKFWLEALGMVLFSLLATQYVLRRRNVSLPFVAHLLIEIALPLTVLFAALNPLTWLLAPGR